MVILLQNDSLGQGISQAGSALGSALQQRGQRSLQERQNKQFGNVLNEVLSDVNLQENPSAFLQALASAQAQGVPSDVIAQYGTLGKILQGGQQKSPFGAKSRDELVTLFEKFGMPNEVAERSADLYSNLTTGGQTDFANRLLDHIQRGNPGGGGLFDIKDNFTETVTDPSNPKNDLEIRESDQFNFPEINPFQGLTPSEGIKRQKELFDVNSKLYKETQEQLKDYKTAERSITQLSNLNNSGKLPKGLGKALNVNYKTGDLRVPSFANPETQLFVKTVNEFIRGAKDSFGARVTNFELDRFLQQLPTLANTEEGRRLILKQMETVNSINQLQGDSLKETFNHYGLRGIDNQQAEVIAEDFRKPRENALIEEFYNVPKQQQDYMVKIQTPKGKIAIEVDGQFGYIDEEEREVAKKKKGVRFL